MLVTTIIRRRVVVKPSRETYDSALKKWTILEPAADKKINAVPDERFGASSTFISDQKVVQFGGVKKRIPPLKTQSS